MAAPPPASAGGVPPELPLDVAAVSAAVGRHILTELEQQVVDLKAEAGRRGALLLVEVGYKWLAFGEDALSLASTLHMCSFRRGHFLVASFPLARLEVHLPTLLHRGFRVSIARQTETAAQKAAGGTPHASLARSLSETHTLATYVPSPAGSGGGGTDHAAPRWLLSVHESAPHRSRAHGGAGIPTLHLLAIDVASGSVLYDELPRKPTDPAGSSRDSADGAGMQGMGSGGAGDPPYPYPSYNVTTPILATRTAWYEELGTHCTTIYL